MFIEFFTNMVTKGGLAAVFLLLFLVALCIPVPSQIPLGFGGYLVSTGELNFWAVVLVGSFGKLTGSILLYVVCRKKGHSFVLQHGKWFRLNEKKLNKYERWFSKWGDELVLVLQFVPMLGSVISIPAGILRLDAWKFIRNTFIGTFIWNIFFVYLGKTLGENWIHIWTVFTPYRNVVYVLACLGLLTFLLYKYRSRWLHVFRTGL
ncbi:MAG: DedA family protein [Candidatus Dojkabacteria bacterium]